MAEQNVHPARHHQAIDPFQVIPNVTTAPPTKAQSRLEIHSDQVYEILPVGNGRLLLPQDANAPGGKKPGDGILRMCVNLMVAQAAEYPVGSFQS